MERGRLRFFCLLLAPGGCLGARGAIPTPPPTRQNKVREVLHGVEIVDPYRRLENQASPETRAIRTGGSLGWKGCADSDDVAQAFARRRQPDAAGLYHTAFPRGLTGRHNLIDPQLAPAGSSIREQRLFSLDWDVVPIGFV